MCSIFTFWLLYSCLGKYEPFFERFYFAISRANELNHKSATAEKARKKFEYFIENRMDPDTLQQLQDAHRSVDEEQLKAAMEVQRWCWVFVLCVCRVFPFLMWCLNSVVTISWMSEKVYDPVLTTEMIV